MDIRIYLKELCLKKNKGKNCVRLFKNASLEFHCEVHLPNSVSICGLLVQEDDRFRSGESVFVKLQKYFE